jgi:hypothetical protein
MMRLTVAILLCSLGTVFGQSPLQRAAILSGGNPIVFSQTGILTGSDTRSTTATYTDASGVIQTAAINTLRDGHYIGGFRTTLLEGARTNLLLRSEEFDNAYWDVSSVTAVTANAVTAPDNQTTADKITELAVSNNHFVRRAAIAVANAAVYTITVYAKAAERSWFAIGDGTTSCYFNVSTGALGTNGGGVFTASSISAAGNGFYRCTATLTTTSASLAVYCHIKTSDAQTTYAGVVGNGLYIWGASLKAGSFADSYIPTTSATVTRSADSYSETQNVASQALTQYDRYWDLATAAWVDSVSAITSGSNYPTTPTSDRAYRYRVVAIGTRDVSWFTARGYTP